MRHVGYWVGWAAITLMASAYLAAVLTTETVGTRTMFVPGRTTSGHHQIELACSSCHTPFAGVTNDACLACHGEELAAANDSHPRAKFTDPRNADLLARLDATACVTCHAEHAPERTRAMGVTVPDDVCWTCHAEIGRERPSHEGMAFDTCASAGCHNYHDNTALYEDFLIAHAGDPALAADPRVAWPRPMPAPRTLPSLPADAPASLAIDASTRAAWEATSHARAGVNCTGCHSAPAADAGAAGWIDAPGVRACAVCHDAEAEGFPGGRHGMRLAVGLSPMTTTLARQPMKAAASGRTLTCGSCHQAHDFETRRAAVDACLLCHDDRHSAAFVGSPHHRLWQRESAGEAPVGTGVSCATCHMPRHARREGGADTPFVQHNQNANLRPNDKMLRTVCLDCHGLAFALDALADPGLVDANFTGHPRASVASIEMAARRATTTSD